MISKRVGNEMHQLRGRNTRGRNTLFLGRCRWPVQLAPQEGDSVDPLPDLVVHYLLVSGVGNLDHGPLDVR